MAQDPNEVTVDPASGSSALSPSPTTDEIRSRIEHTRAEMSETIDAIHARLSPTRFVTEAKETVKRATFGRAKNLAQRASLTARDLAKQSPLASDSVLQRVRENPVPVALAGIATTRLILRSLKRFRPKADERARHAGRAHWGGRGTARSTTALLLTAAGACAGCWAIWRAAQAASKDKHRHTPERTPRL